VGVDLGIVATMELEAAARVGVDVGLDAAAILDPKGKPLAIAGDLDANTARALTAFAARDAQQPDLLDRLKAGKLLRTVLDDREVNIAVVAGSVFVVVVLPRERAKLSFTAIDDLLVGVANILSKATESSRCDVPPPPASSSSGGSSGPADLQVVELGVTVPRGRN
jgi:hypothetical protein